MNLTKLKNIVDINNIEALLKSLKPNDKKKFLEELMKKCQFNKDEFYSNYENKKIKLLCFLNEKGFLMKPNNEETEENEEKDEKEERENYYNKLIDILDEITADLEEGKINKYQLEEFLKNKNIIQKLELLKLVLNDYNPEAKNLEFKQLIEEINGKITRLKNIKDSLSKFHRSIYIKDIKKIATIIDDIEKNSINDYKKMTESIQEIVKHGTLCKQINSVKDLLLFKIIFDNTLGNNQKNN